MVGHPLDAGRSVEVEVERGGTGHGMRPNDRVRHHLELAQLTGRRWSRWERIVVRVGVRRPPTDHLLAVIRLEQFERGRMSRNSVAPPPETGICRACSTVAAAGHGTYESSVWKNWNRPGRRSSPPNPTSPRSARSSSVRTKPGVDDLLRLAIADRIACRSATDELLDRPEVLHDRAHGDIVERAVLTDAHDAEAPKQNAEPLPHLRQTAVSRRVQPTDLRDRELARDHRCTDLGMPHTGFEGDHRMTLTTPGDVVVENPPAGSELFIARSPASHSTLLDSAPCIGSVIWCGGVASAVRWCHAVTPDAGTAAPSVRASPRFRARRTLTTKRSTRRQAEPLGSCDPSTCPAHSALTVPSVGAAAPSASSPAGGRFALGSHQLRWRSIWLSRAAWRI